jgi:hypothetical protein
MDPIDFYKDPALRPKVIRYEMNIFATINGVFLNKNSVYFDKNDDHQFAYKIEKIGAVDFDEYMLFLHEIYKSSNMNLNNDYFGTWYTNM